MSQESVQEPNQEPAQSDRSAPPAAPPPFDTLTQTQLEVAIEIALGAKNPEIAQRRCVSTKTIDTHRGAVMRLLALKSNVHLARLALRVGLVKLDASEDL